jgi:lactoylglutathione lyase
MSQYLQIYTDGGARGNPGLAAIAFVALNERGETVKTDASFIGVRTNNQAEYEALLLALNYAAKNKAQEVFCHLDSELVARQLRGEYAVKNADLQQLWRKVQELKGSFKKISFIYVPRENLHIQRADALVNKTIDEQNRKQAQRLVPEKNTGEGCVFLHTSIRTSNIERSIDFYSRLLGLRLLSRREIKATNAEIAFLQDAEGKGCKLELTYYRNQTRFSQPDYEERTFDHLGFEVSDLEKTIGAMRKENVVVTDEPFELNEHTTIAFIEDPDGTLIELVQRK